MAFPFPAMRASAQNPRLFFPVAYANEQNVLLQRRIVDQDTRR